MNNGLLWIDNDAWTGLREKVEKAAEYYRKQYGEEPNLCMVHPDMLGENQVEPMGMDGKIVIRTNRTILPGQLWIGIDDKV